MTRMIIASRVWLPLVALLALVSLPQSVTAQTPSGAAGSLDASFGGDGTVTTDLGNRDEHLRAVEVQPDGKIVAAGYTQKGDHFHFALVRYKSNGSLDAGFGDGGTVVTKFGHHAHIHGMTLQPDGKIVAVGHTHTLSNDDFIMARYNADGSLDTSFNADGKASLDFAGGFDYAFGAAVQPDGKVLVAGSASVDGSYDFALARLDPDGALDATFGTDGRVTTAFEPPGGDPRSDTAQALALQADGKIVLAGYSGADFALARVDADGALDATFGTGGKVTTRFDDEHARIYKVAVNPDGKIVAMGRSFTDTNSEVDFEVARYNADGTLDATFGDGGKVRTDLGAGEYGYAGTVQPDGKIVMVGYRYDPVLGADPASHQQLLVRYEADGTLDDSFGDDGVVRTSVGHEDQVYAVALQPDGGIIAAGNSSIDGDYDLVVTRYHGRAQQTRAVRPPQPVTLRRAGPSPNPAAPGPPPADSADAAAAAPTPPPTGPPTVAEPLADLVLEGPEWREISLAGVFHDPDGDDLTFSAASSNGGVASVWVEGATLTVVGVFTDTATITVTAQDSERDEATDSFEVAVMPDS